MLEKKLLIILMLICSMVFSLFSRDANHDTDNVDFAKALQISLYFYDAEKCGPGISDTKLEWRGDCHTEDALFPVEELQLPASTIQHMNIITKEGTGEDGEVVLKEYVDLSGGFHDAGDHVRFGLPQSYAISTLAWGLFEFEEMYKKTGTYEHILDIVKWGTDTYLKTTVLDPESEKVLAHCYMVGEGGTDHTYWGAPELQHPVKFDRPADFATPEGPASDMAAGASAALAIMALIYERSGKADAAEYSAKCLKYAESLYEFSLKYRGLGKGDGFYGSNYDDDEMAWAAVWLYENTRDSSYIDHIISYNSDGIYTGYLKKIISTTNNTWQNIWVHCWDTVWGGVFTRLASIQDREDLAFLEEIPPGQETNGTPESMKQKLDYYARWNLEYWSHIPHDDPADKSYLFWSPQNYAMINTWGSARYNTAAQLCMLVYQMHKQRRGEDIMAKPFHLWALDQINYLFGDNELDRVYMVGYDERSVQNPHHRASHGSKKNSMLEPAEQLHTLWGALAGGPDGDDKHVDVTWDYVYNEVAIDYNAAFVGALAGHYYFWQQESNPEPAVWTPPKEPEVDEYYAEAKIEQENQERTQITIKLHNETIHPPRNETEMKVRYFVDLSEVYGAGQNTDAISMEIYYDEVATGSGGTSTVVTGPHPWNFEDGKRIYYYEFDWTPNIIYGDRDIQFALLAAQDANWQSHWNPANDHGRQGLTTEMAKTNYIPVYIGDKLVFGEEPERGLIVEPPKTFAAKMQYRCGETREQTGSIVPMLNIVRINGDEVVNLSSLKARYYFSRDALSGPEGEAVSELKVNVDYAALGSQLVTAEIVHVEGNNYYAEIGFTGEAGFFGSLTGEIKIRIHHNAYEDLDQTNDYSFDPLAEDNFIEFDKVTLHKDGELLWGTAP